MRAAWTRVSRVADACLRPWPLERNMASCAFGSGITSSKLLAEQRLLVPAVASSPCLGFGLRTRRGFGSTACHSLSSSSNSDGTLKDSLRRDYSKDSSFSTPFVEVNRVSHKTAEVRLRLSSLTLTRPRCTRYLVPACQRHSRFQRVLASTMKSA